MTLPASPLPERAGAAPLPERAEGDSRGRPSGPWLVALDVDGTVIHEDETLDDAVAAAVRTARDRGHEVTLATGRSWHTVVPILKALGLTPEYVVCSNGAITMRREGDVLGEGAPDYVRDHVETFDPTEVLLTVREHLPEGRFLLELPDGTRLNTAGMVDWDLHNATEVDFEDLLGVEATRFVVVSPDHDIVDFLRIVEDMGLHRVSYSVGWTAWLDIAPDGVNKATALERVRERLDVPRSRVLAVGDGRNDIEMFEWARLAGRAVAMGQAPDEVKAVATEVTGTILENGLVPVLLSLPDASAG